MENNIQTDKSINDYCKRMCLPKYKSKITSGTYTIYHTEHFNWLQKRMWKILLGIKIEDVGE